MDHGRKLRFVEIQMELDNKVANLINTNTHLTVEELSAILAHYKEFQLYSVQHSKFKEVSDFVRQRAGEVLAFREKNNQRIKPQNLHIIKT